MFGEVEIVPFFEELLKFGAINTESFKCEVVAQWLGLINILDIASTLINKSGQSSSHIDASIVLFQTIQFFFIRAKKCLLRWFIYYS